MEQRPCHLWQWILHSCGLNTYPETLLEVGATASIHKRLAVIRGSLLCSEVSHGARGGSTCQHVYTFVPVATTMLTIGNVRTHTTTILPTDYSTLQATATTPLTPTHLHTYNLCMCTPTYSNAHKLTHPHLSTYTPTHSYAHTAPQPHTSTACNLPSCRCTWEAVSESTGFPWVISRWKDLCGWEQGTPPSVHTEGKDKHQWGGCIHRDAFVTLWDC